MTGTLHVVGAGIAGLACAVSAAQAGRKVVVYEATKQAGGRCRSFFDSQLNTTVDNGSHAILGANPAIFSYLSAINAESELVPVESTGEIPFVDLKNGTSWTLRPNPGLFPSWIFDAERRAAGTQALDYIKGGALLVAGKKRSVASVLKTSGNTWRNFWEPLSTAVMNTSADQASAYLLGKALGQAVATRRGGLRSYVPKTSLHDTFIEPALKVLKAAGAQIRFDTPLSAVTANSHVVELRMRSEKIAVLPHDSVVLALPPWAPAILPFLGEAFKPEASPIVNAHFQMDLEEPPPAMVGLIGGTAHWLFTRPGVVSVTVSADQSLADAEHGEIAARLWSDACLALNLNDQSAPPSRVIVERRATPIQDASFVLNRPGPRTHAENLFLAGDWVDTGLPCTLESAVRSGVSAADYSRNIS
ncbi:MAG: FAD-dependent oxidoreductase [Rhodospirillaceae bacterium]|nr:FAD-dependent oxidoreductase [Rhodospirillaceae bacterium]MBT5566826.1 FAD-dependent oxidoreductase [Rhodospirillaceae bacterium]MBT6089461.1 FAD-dependent oxidoreductase [Rhodospirillaceae bacterium]MBT6959771.1 FAD-dependent oxidoreductase [Rhodospirillaceae bacterium]